MTNTEINSEFIKNAEIRFYPFAKKHERWVVNITDCYDTIHTGASDTPDKAWQRAKFSILLSEDVIVLDKFPFGNDLKNRPYWTIAKKIHQNVMKKGDRK